MQIVNISYGKAKCENIMLLKVVAYGLNAAMFMQHAKKLAVQMTPNQNQCI